MANFEPKQLVANEINNGNKYRDGVDSPQADAFNRLIEAILYAQEKGVNVNITVDSEFSETSTNPVQNKVVTEALDGKVDIIDNSTSAMAKIYGVLPKQTSVTAISLQSDIYPASQVIPGVIPRYQDIRNVGDTEPTTLGTLIFKPPQKPYQVSNKKYVDDIKAELLGKIEAEWYENIITSPDDYIGAYVSATKLPNPKKIRIDGLGIAKTLIPDDSGEVLEFYAIDTPQIFDITPDTNGRFSVIVHANLYIQAIEIDGNWVIDTPTLQEQNIPLTLNFIYSWDDEDGDGINETLIKCESLSEGISSYDNVTVSLYI